MEKTSVLMETCMPIEGDIKMRLLYPQTVKESSLNMSSFDKEQAAFDDINAANIHFEDATNIAHLHRAILRRYA